MAGYLEKYGAGEEQREKLIKRVALLVAVVLIVGGVAYFLLRNYRETRQVKLFFELLGKKDYAAAYQLWGCTQTAPCRNYNLDKFMEDWGPRSPHASLSALKITKTRGCDTGVIFETNFGQGEPVYLWVDRATRNLGFAPWPVCNPRMPNSPVAPL
jgi:hypothetical protein